MYPIERDDYINAYIGAISEEMRRSRAGRHHAIGTSGALDRLYRSVAGLLNRGGAGTHQTTDPLPAS
jgi:hypothetical protein